jgi:hypothetical protein
MVPQSQAVQEEFFLGIPDCKDGGTMLNEVAQTDCYMILKVFMDR